MIPVAVTVVATAVVVAVALKRLGIGGIGKQPGALYSQFEKDLLTDTGKGLAWLAKKLKQMADELHENQLKAFRKNFEDILNTTEKKLAKVSEYGSDEYMGPLYKARGIVVKQVGHLAEGVREPSKKPALPEPLVPPEPPKPEEGTE